MGLMAWNCISFFYIYKSGFSQEKDHQSDSAAQSFLFKIVR